MTKTWKDAAPAADGTTDQDRRTMLKTSMGLMTVAALGHSASAHAAGAPADDRRARGLEALRAVGGGDFGRILDPLLAPPLSGSAIALF
ncbi:hypothetical protein BC361_05805 [Ensifer sp. LC54]|nr:hypothetical protein BC361_05805 [Ensifer sp. LC54]OCP27351.1 hypothetical protein BC363_14655 [Ensifer sp. LC384]